MEKDASGSFFTNRPKMFSILRKGAGSTLLRIPVTAGLRTRHLHDLRILVGVLRDELSEFGAGEIAAPAHLLHAEIAEYGDGYFRGGEASGF